MVLVWRKADEAANDYLYRGIEKTVFRVNTIGPKVHLTPGSIASCSGSLRPLRVERPSFK
jgi:hypothetical protein